MVSLAVNHDLFDGFGVDYRHKKGNLVVRLDSLYFFLIRSPKKNYSASLATVFFSAIRAFLPVSLRK